MKPIILQSRNLALILLALLSSHNPQLSASPLGTAFTYQGQLASGGQAANGVYDLRFAIYDALDGGGVAGGPLTNTVGVSNGLFTTTLDFGATVFTGQARWLEIAVSTNVAGHHFATVAGGAGNRAWHEFTTVGGGFNNVAAGAFSTVLGGSDNEVFSDHSLAAGHRAKVLNPGSFAWADSTEADFVSLMSDEFAVRAAGGMRLESLRGINLNAADAPLITRGWNPFAATAGEAKAGLGRWGLFMEPFKLVAGIPDTDVGERAFEVWRYDTNGLHNPLFSIGNTDATASFYGNIFCNSNASAATLSIRGGADLAEPFAMSTHSVQAGTVVVIDETQPGRLKLSTHAYDRKVAGIVSGAGGVQPGIRMIQETALEGGQNVALSGRVYALADAAYGEIQPGDLLTTADTPGHAMKASDHAQAQGAVLGKAMSALPKGRGLVLVLVTLQ